MEIEIRNERQLTEWENRIGALFQRHEFDYVLGGVRQSLKDLYKFTAAGISLCAIRYSLPPIARPDNMRVMPWSEMAPMANLVTQYLITDPATFDLPPTEDHYHDSTLIPIVLRLAGNQFPYDVAFFGQYARALKLFHFIPQQLGKSVPQYFDIDMKFQNLTGLNLIDFIHVGYGSFAASTAKSAFTGGWFQQARNQGMKFDDEVVTKALEQLAGNQWQLRELYESYRQPDRRYGMHDFNPLLVYPLVRPWPKRESMSLNDDRLLAPLPGLILTRLSEGIYHQMFLKHRENFARYFGYVFEKYVGEVLKHSIPNRQLLSERDIQRTYKTGKVPDYVFIDGKTAVLIECKATGLQRKAVATADSTAIDRSIDRIIEGLIQLNEFKEACAQPAPGLEQLAACTDFKLLIVTFERFYIINSMPFKEVIAKKLITQLKTRPATLSSWYVLSVEELETMQPHFQGGVSFSAALNELLSHRHFQDLLKESADKTGLSYKDSFLYEIEKDIWERLNIRPEGLPTEMSISDDSSQTQSNLRPSAKG